MKNVKIVVVGIGSASFGPKTLGDVFCRPELSGSTLCLVDLRAEAVEAISGRLPTDAELRNWRVYTTALRRLFMADGSDARTMIVTDENYVTLRRRKIGYLPRRMRGDA